MKVPGREFERLYEESLMRARESLRSLKVASGNEPEFPGLGGWVFEQTVQHCLRRELGCLDVPIEEQAKLGSRGRADLKIGSIFVELKLRGIFSRDAIDRYARYAQIAKGQGQYYLYLTKGESYRPYREGIRTAVGRMNAFFLDVDRDWPRFIKRVRELLARSE